MADSTLSLTFTQSKKTVVATGKVAIREASIDVTVVGGASLVSDLVLKIQDRSNNGATAPIGIVSSWSVSGLNAVGTLNLNTEEAIDAFSESGNLSFKTFNIVLFTSTSNALMCNGVIDIMNFPVSTSSDPVTLDQTATIAALTARIEQLEATASVALTFDQFAALDFTDLSTNALRNAALRALLAICQGA